VNRYAIIVFWSEEDGVRIADAPDLKSCSAFGATPEEALAELCFCDGCLVRAAREAGYSIPQARYQPHHEAAE
jgi:predicted RNase H-like HicB family nuclease